MFKGFKGQTDTLVLKQSATVLLATLHFIMMLPYIDDVTGSPCGNAHGLPVTSFCS